MVPHVIPVGDDVRTGIMDLARDLTRQPRTPRGVLAVDDDEVDPPFAFDRRDERRDRLTAGLTDDIADEEDPHRDVSKGARSVD